ncbi:MAG: tRNA dihydrouridine synthase DusB [Alphaproteobacteria bacterium]|nr:tRNA dihydrouridine synthase DusB [Alphaproteobacteria bacterium]MBT5390451.1 tRNA dihydrouridine synthase DusB [Alphaproteobacteria bacterium]MBT5654731.1 tRNA dihydrouridine synthase DusB [Alphaproteobacteria bacterium]
MLKPLQIGPVTVQDPVILAPMSGVTDLPFRRLVKRHGVGLVISEMIASQAMIRATRQSLKKCELHPEEHPMAVQLAGCEPNVMAEAAKLTEDLGAAIIDINMGCPVKKVVNGHAGSALMRDELHAAKILEATVKAVSVPVTLKMRTGWDHDNRNAPSLAKVAEESGIQMITIHGRTRCQLYNGKADWSFIKQVKEAISLPVIGNGDVKTYEDVDALLEQSGADGIMIGRGTYGKPWFLSQVIEYLKTGNKNPTPPLEYQKMLILEHLQGMASHYGELVGIRMARKHLSWYSKGLPSSAEFRSEINRCETLQKAEELIIAYYNPIVDGGG